MDDEERKRRVENSRIHEEIWDAHITPAFNRSNRLIDAKKGDPPEHLLHFTTASAVLSILPNRTLRVSRARASNDPKELEHGIRIAREEQDKVTHDAVDAIFRDELLASYMGRMTDGTEKHHLDAHICCFTENDNADLVAHWAMYGRDGSGFALDFNGKALDKPYVTLVKVSYDEQEHRAHMRELLALAKDTCRQAGTYAYERYGDIWGERTFRLAGHAFGAIVALHAATMKAPEFAAEKEWRLIHPGYGFDLERCFEAKGSILRTFFDVKFEPDDLLSIIVGPVCADLNRPMIWRLLREHGYANTKVETGKVALRTL